MEKCEDPSPAIEAQEGMCVFRDRFDGNAADFIKRQRGE